MVDNSDLLVFRRRLSGANAWLAQTRPPACVMANSRPAYPLLRCTATVGALGHCRDNGGNHTNDVIVRVAVEVDSGGHADAFFRIEPHENLTPDIVAAWLIANKLELVNVDGGDHAQSLANLVAWLFRHMNHVANPPGTQSAWTALENTDPGIVWDVVVNMYASDVRFHEKADVLGHWIQPEYNRDDESYNYDWTRPRARASPFYDSVCAFFARKHGPFKLEIFEHDKEVSARGLEDWRHVLLDMKLDLETTPATFAGWQMDLRLYRDSGAVDNRWALALENEPQHWHEGIVASFLLIHAVYTHFRHNRGDDKTDLFDKLVAGAVGAYDETVVRDDPWMHSEGDDHFIMGSYGDGEASFVLQSEDDETRGDRVWRSMSSVNGKDEQSGRELAEQLDTNDPAIGNFHVTRATPDAVEQLFQAPWSDSFSWNDETPNFWPFHEKSIEGFLCVVKNPDRVKSTDWRGDIQHTATVHTHTRPYPWVVCPELTFDDFRDKRTVDVRWMTASELRHTKQSATFLDMPADVSVQSNGTNAFVEFTKPTYVQQNGLYECKNAGDKMMIVGLQPGEQKLHFSTNMPRPRLGRDGDRRIIIDSWGDAYTPEERGTLTSLPAIKQVFSEEPTFDMIYGDGMIVKSVIINDQHTECRTMTLEAVQKLIANRDVDVTVLLLPSYRAASIHIDNVDHFTNHYKPGSKFMNLFGRMELRDAPVEESSLLGYFFGGTGENARLEHGFNPNLTLKGRFERGTNESVALEVYEEEEGKEWLCVHTWFGESFRSVHAINNAIVSNLSLSQLQHMDFRGCVFTVSSAAVTVESNPNERLFLQKPSLRQIQNLRQEVNVHTTRSGDFRSAEVCIERVEFAGCYEAFQRHVHSNQTLLVSALLKHLPDPKMRKIVDVANSSARACSIDSSGTTCSIYIDLRQIVTKTWGGLGNPWGNDVLNSDFDESVKQLFAMPVHEARRGRLGFDSAPRSDNMWTRMIEGFGKERGVEDIVGSSLRLRITGTRRTSVRDEVRVGFELWRVNDSTVVRSVMVPTEAALATTPMLRQVVRGAKLATIGSKEVVHLGPKDIYDAVYTVSQAGGSFINALAADPDVHLTFQVEESIGHHSDKVEIETLVPDALLRQPRTTAAPFAVDEDGSPVGTLGHWVSGKFKDGVLPSRYVTVQNLHSVELARLHASIRVVDDGLVVEHPVQVEGVFFDVGTRVIGVNGEAVKDMDKPMKMRLLQQANIKNWQIIVPTYSRSKRRSSRVVKNLTRDERNVVQLLVANIVGCEEDDEDSTVAYVQSVDPRGGAYSKGVRAGDRVLKIGDMRVATHGDEALRAAWDDDDTVVDVELGGCTDAHVLAVLVKQAYHDRKFNENNEVLDIRGLDRGIQDTSAFNTTNSARFSIVSRLFAGDPAQTTNMYKLRNEISRRSNDDSATGMIETGFSRVLGGLTPKFGPPPSGGDATEWVFEVNLKDYESLGVTSVIRFDWKGETGETFVQTVDRRGVAWGHGLRCGNVVESIITSKEERVERGGVGGFLFGGVEPSKEDQNLGRDTKTSPSKLLAAIRERVATWEMSRGGDTVERFEAAVFKRNAIAKFYKNNLVIKLAMLHKTNRFDDGDDAALRDLADQLKNAISSKFGRKMCNAYFPQMVTSEKSMSWIDELFSRTLFSAQRLDNERGEYERVVVDRDRAHLKTILDACNLWFPSLDQRSDSTNIDGMTFRVPVVLNGTHVDVGRRILMINKRRVGEYTPQTLRTAFAAKSIELELDPRFAQRGEVVYVPQQATWGCTYQCFRHAGHARGRLEDGDVMRAVYIESVKGGSEAHKIGVDVGHEVLEVNNCHVSEYTYADFERALCKPARLRLSDDKSAKAVRRRADLMRCCVAETVFDATDMVQGVRGSLAEGKLDVAQSIFYKLQEMHLGLHIRKQTLHAMPLDALRKEIELRVAASGNGMSWTRAAFEGSSSLRRVTNEADFLGAYMEPFYNHDGTLNAVYVVYSGAESRGRTLGLEVGVRVRMIWEDPDWEELDSTFDVNDPDGKLSAARLVQLLHDKSLDIVVENAPDMDGLRGAWKVKDLNERWWSDQTILDVVNDIVTADTFGALGEKSRAAEAQAKSFESIVKKIEAVFVDEKAVGERDASTLLNLLMGLLPLVWERDGAKLTFKPASPASASSTKARRNR